MICCDHEEMGEDKPYPADRRSLIPWMFGESDG